MPKTKSLSRCKWPGEDPLYIAYHDEEWGVPERDTRALYEKLVLDGFQAGLSWITILRKREAFRKAFKGFKPELVAHFNAKDIDRLLADAGIVRHRGKIEGAVAGARATLELEADGGLTKFLWDFVGGVPIQNAFKGHGDIPAATPLSREVSKALKARGFKFCGPTIVYAFMQAVGMVNDHVVTCFRHAPLAASHKRGTRVSH
jgi:DNA-3-methyladenine glycosylase I